MYCPKCGLQNLEASKFCRGCGVDLSYVMAAVEGKVPAGAGLSEKYVEQFSRGVRGLLIGGGFVVVAVLGYLVSTRSLAFSLFALAFAMVFLGTGVSRLIHAAGLRRLSEGKPLMTLEAGKTEYISPERSIYDTDDLKVQPMSVTDRTTRHLQAEDKDR